MSAMHRSRVAAGVFEPPDNWMPGRVAESVLLVHSDRIAVFADGFSAVPSGFSFTVTIVSREPIERYERGLAYGPRAENLTVRYADGTASAGAMESGKSGPRLIPRGGSGTDSTFRQDWWCAPLPPSGPVQFEIRLPSGDATGTLDAAVLLDAAERAIQFWPDREPEPPVIDQRAAPALPPPGRQPADPEAVRHEIRDAFLTALDGTDPSPDPMAAIQDGPALAGAREQARRNHPLPSTTIRVAVGDIVFIDEVRAAVVFQLNWSGAMTFGPQLGYAIREGGRWRVARDTYCRVLGWAGVTCPPPPPLPPTS